MGSKAVNIIQKLQNFFNGVKTGKVEKIDLTWGGAGNQVMTIDGVEYATWVDYTRWPKIGGVVTHRPYKEWYRGEQMLCTRIQPDE